MSFEYLRGDKLLLPYIPDKFEFKEDTLVEVYNKLKKEDLFSIVFHDNPKLDLNSFIKFFSSPVVTLSFFCQIVDGVEDLSGMCWLSDSYTAEDKVKKANGNFVFFRKYQLPNITKEFGEMALEFWLNVMSYNIITGITPALNRAALIYIKRLGFIEAGRISNYVTYNGNICDGVITYISKERYKNGR
jgi:hypothetical protein